MTDDFPPITVSGGGSKADPLPKGSYKVVVTKVTHSPISDWPDWKVERAVENHNEREAARVEDYKKDDKEYAPHLASIEGGVAEGLTAAESAQYVFYMRVVGGKHDGEQVRPYYAGVNLNADIKYRSKANLYKLLDAALPDVEAAIAAGTLDPREVVGYPFMVSLGVTDKGNNKIAAVMPSDDHGEKMDALVMEGATVVPGDDSPDLPF